MTGLDFSGAAVAEATRLAAAVGADASFVQADVYDAAGVLQPGSFDLVYTGVGALTWLPDIRRWGRVVADLLRPGGRLFIRDGHPMLYTLDVDGDGRLVVAKPYFETVESRVSDYAGTYVQTGAAIEHTVTHWWNHGIGETVTALLDAGLVLTGLVEHDTVPAPVVRGDDGECWRWRVAAGRSARTARRQLHHTGRQKLLTAPAASTLFLTRLAGRFPRPRSRPARGGTSCCRRIQLR